MWSGDVNLRTRAIAAGFLFAAGVAGGLILSRKISQFLFQSSQQANAAGGERGGEQKREGKGGGGASGGERESASGKGGGKSSKSDGSEDSDKSEREGEGKEKKDAGKKSGGGKSGSNGGSEGSDKNEKGSADKKDADQKNQASATPKLDAVAARAVLAGNSVQKPNPGGEVHSIHYGMRNFVGESEGDGVFAVRRWGLTDDQLCEADPKLGPQCRPLDVQFTPENAARLRPKGVKPAQKDGLYDDAAALVASLPKGALIGTIAADDTRYLVLKGNVAGFPDYIPTLDEGRLPDVTPDAVATRLPDAPARKSGFVEVAATSGFKVANSGAAALEGSASEAPERQASGSAAMEDLRGRLLRGGRLLRDQTPARLAWLRTDGTFMQIMREEDRPFEVRLKLSPWKASGERFCREKPGVAGRGKAANQPPKPVEECLVPKLGGITSNLTNDSGEKLILYPKLDPPRIRL
jgi:hypothetical protein